ncbi:ATP-dependent DNA helicase RecG [Novipirellula artificiosorum]|uniref:Probable DNA 3'-5' helicase RecG n=1 Tax=Novipirellula artificiosorum TaxID=2528016 RepID=A0A5C6DG22_9BACT|nr:ATP-dependent DNA helicase RecG [Novipirellula artificiosorum]TWU35135.1 ATP-dependent DNA helicase RecG [Novipirellula artificiosorum]
MEENSKPPVRMSTPLPFLSGMGNVRANRLAKLGLRTAQDVAFFFPRDYERPAPPRPVGELREGEPASLIGKITDVELASRSPGKSVFGAIVENETGAVRILFFNQPYRAEQLRVDQKVMISGTPKLTGLRMEFVHPQITLFDSDEDIAKPKMLALYSLTEGVRQKDLRVLVADVLEAVAGQFVEVMPLSLRESSAQQLREAGIELAGTLPEIETALQQIHQPTNEASMQAARTRLVFQELLVMQLALAMRRRKLTSDLKSPPLTPSAMIDARILNRFPFELTSDQLRAIQEIKGDMSCQFPMNRLLQGDVGSGKTVVAVYAMMLAVANEHQAVMMAPTEVLARQHFDTLNKILAGSRVRIGLLCGSLTKSQRSKTIRQAAAGEIDILVGTQALLYGDIQFNKLGLCVIDEQHKFGVGQRVALRSGGVDPHYLVMSATPIPRSMAMTLFGDVELSTLREKPPGRATVNTYLAHDGWKDRWWSFVRDRLQEGRQAFVVAPRVLSSNDAEEEKGEEASEDVSSVETVYQDLCEKTLPDFRIGLLHGRMRSEDKLQTMRAFSEGRFDVLVSTTVIEVGIDVPNATVMTIFGAERFGLAQLHQLRGRISRGSHAGHLCLFTDGDLPPTENERLKLLEETEDGFALAEADFRLRGPGDLLGRKQSGLAPLRIADPSRDLEILIVARAMAQSMIDENPELDSPELERLKAQVMRRYGKRLDLGDVA